jgi:hypothetical protein
MQLEFETKNVANDYINWRLIKAGYIYWCNNNEIDLNKNINENNAEVKHLCLLMRNLCTKFENYYNKSFKLLCSEFHITNENYKAILTNVSNELFINNIINWPRIVALFTFCGCLAVKCYEKEMQNVIYEIINWLINYLNKREFLEWIQSKGNWVCATKYFYIFLEPENDRYKMMNHINLVFFCS